MLIAVDKHIVAGIKRTAQRVEEAYHSISEVKEVDGAGQIYISSLEAACRTFNLAVIDAERVYGQALGED